MFERFQPRHEQTFDEQALGRRRKRQARAAASLRRNCAVVYVAITAASSPAGGSSSTNLRSPSSESETMKVIAPAAASRRVAGETDLSRRVAETAIDVSEAEYAAIGRPSARSRRAALKAITGAVAVQSAASARAGFSSARRVRQVCSRE